MTEQSLLDRVRGVVVATADPFTMTETLDPNSFALSPAGTVDGTFRVQFTTDQPIGGMGFYEEVIGTITVSVAKATNADYDACRRALVEMARALTNAVVRDGEQESGEYTVLDAGRHMDIVGEPGAAFLTLRLQLPVNFETAL